MANIVQIPPHIVSRIAAGEVIERPVYAVKELIENALDAQATAITVQIESGGLKKIVVTDNGIGMNKTDLLESFKPHTTSKLVDDSLQGIETLGFRGEALASIAAVSDMYIQSRTNEDTVGVQVVLKAGTVTKIAPVGMPFGTSITVENIFYPVPARKKFLKSERTEFRHIVELVSEYAMSFPDVRFLLLHNNRIILDVPHNQTSIHRLEALLKKTIVSQLLPVSAEDSYITIGGYIAHPQLSTPTQSKQYIFINNRVVKDRFISSAIKQEFGTLLAKTQHPIFILDIQMPYEMVDVNVHPRKEQVSVVNHESLIQFIRSAVSNTLEHNNLSFSVPREIPYSSRRGSTDSEDAQLLREAQELWSVKDPVALSDLDSIYQIHNTYLVLQTKSGLVLVDQHAAHERILYEQIMSTYTKEVQDIYVLKKPILLDLTVRDSEIIKEYLPYFLQSGFEIKEDKSRLSLYSIPRLFNKRDVNQLVVEIADRLGEVGSFTSVDGITDMMIAYLACRGAIKAGEKLTKDEAKRLLEKLENTPHNATCPHGRPTKISLSLQNLHKWFRRE